MSLFTVHRRPATTITSRPPIPPKLPSRQLKSVESTLNGYAYRNLNGGLDMKSDQIIKPIEVSLNIPLSRASTPSELSECTSYRLQDFSRESSVIGTYTRATRSPSVSTSSRSRINLSRSSVTPRRVFPQTYSNSNGIDLHELEQREPSSTIFNGRLMFDVKSSSQSLYQKMEPQPAYEDPQTASNYLSSKIQNFLKRTDHVMEEWSKLGRNGKDDDLINTIERMREKNRGNSVGRSQSVTNILIKGFQMSKTMPPTERSSSVMRERKSSISSQIDHSDDTLLGDDGEVLDNS